MNERERREMIDGYLRTLARELEDMPAGPRQELIDDLRNHIEDAWESAPERNQAALLNILERLGRPEELAREERERLGIPRVPDRQGPGLLEVAAVALTALFWPVGILLAWLSPRWHTLDKVVATLIPVVGFALLIASSMVAMTAYTSGPVVASSRTIEVHPESEATSPVGGPQGEVRPVTETTPGSQHEWWRTAGALFGRVMVLFGLLGAPFTSALYLALRMRPGPRRSALLLPAAAGVLMTVSILVAILIPIAA